jgi:S-sulfo-L-cysteine synthase (O-acetyl-L-serine-dependent)
MATIIDLIGNTPLVELKKLNPNKKVKIFAKLEGQNPGGSVKDRPALFMIQEAIKSGQIKSGDKLIEATSGNTGIALAMIAKSFNLHLTLVMTDDSTIERVKTMRAYGAEIILTPAEKTIEFSRELALEKAKNENLFVLNQFSNPNNYKAHYQTTGPEIWRDTDQKITHFVSSMGTTGTIMGTSMFLKEQNPDIQIIGCQPTEGSKIPGIRKWSPEFLPEIYEPKRVDNILFVNEEQAKQTTRKLAIDEGIFAGMSSGGACFSAIELAKKIDSGVIVFIACDRGDRYLSSTLFE